jgi:anti-anti-sigma factor
MLRGPAGHGSGVPTPFQLDTARDGDVATVRLAGELDMGATFSLEPQIDRLLADDEVRRLVVDLRAVTFVDSTGLRLLLEIHQRAERAARELSILRPEPTVQRVFTLAGLDDVLPFEG